MLGNENEVRSNSENQFFGNDKVPYCLKAGAGAVLLHGTIDYRVTPENHNAFLAMFFDKDINSRGQSTKIVSGSMTFTFGKPESMGKDNCQASIKQLLDLYPSIGDVFDNISEGKGLKSDKEICSILAEASAKRFKHNETGSMKNWDLFVSKNIDKYIKKIQSHYPGMLPNSVYENLKTTFENACKKKTVAQTAQQM